jgi:hypothetical protein
MLKSLDILFKVLITLVMFVDKHDEHDESAHSYLRSCCGSARAVTESTVAVCATRCYPLRLPFSLTACREHGRVTSTTAQAACASQTHAQCATRLSDESATNEEAAGGHSAKRTNDRHTTAFSTASFV